MQQALGLATGRTMEPLYVPCASLSYWPEAELAALRRGWLSFNLDEYLGLQSQIRAATAASWTITWDIRWAVLLGAAAARWDKERWTRFRLLCP